VACATEIKGSTLVCLPCVPCIPWFVLLVCSLSNAAEPTPARKLVNSPGVLVIGHRGNSSVAPENTLPSFAKAIEVKADLVELDYHHSADGVPVVIHDEFLDKTTDARTVFGKEKLPVKDLPLAELARLDAGAWFGPEFKGTKVPTLVEALRTIQASSTTLIERKAGDAAILVKLLEREKVADRVVVFAFDWEFVKDCRRLSPTLTLGTLYSKTSTPELIDEAAAIGVDLIAWNQEKLKPEHIELIHKHGKKAWVYTVDDPRRAADLIAAGIDGLITNKPAEMMRVRNAERGVRNGVKP
jgi:glycerophosphoryl diester phosphodiesterase